jgi:hypothetical protein
MSREQFERMLVAAEYLANHIHEAPVWIIPCLEGGTDPHVGIVDLPSGSKYAAGG